MSERMAKIAPSAIEMPRYSSAVPRPRKLWLISVGLSCLLNLILVVVVLVRPTPNFATSVLFKLRTAESASLTRRWLPPEHSDVSAMTNKLVTPAPQINNSKKRSDYWISAGWNVECQVDADQYLCRVWDPQGATWQTQGPVTIHDTTTMTLSSADTATTITSYDTGASASTTTSPSSSPTPSSAVQPSSTTTEIASSPVPSASTNDTITGVFVGLWIGPMGACLEKRGAFKICSSPSFTPDNSKIYAQSGLDPRVIQVLPTGTAGGTVMLLFSLMAYCVAVAVFTMAYGPATRARTREGNRSYESARYIWLLAIATLANGIGVVAVLISLIIFSRVFKNALNRIPELPFELFAEGGGGSSPLTASCVFGVISTAIGIFIVIDDLKLVLREAAQTRSRREAKAEKKRSIREKRRKRSRWNRRPSRSGADTHMDNDETRRPERPAQAAAPAMQPSLYPRGLDVPDFLSARTPGLNPSMPLAEADLLPLWMQGPAADRGETRYARNRGASASRAPMHSSFGGALPSNLKMPNVGRISERLRFWK